MMLSTLLGRTLYEKRWFLVGWSLAFAVMTVLILMFYPSFSQAGGFDQVAKTLPEQLKGFIGDPSVFRTIDGYIASQIFDIRMSLMLVIMTLVLAISITVREEEAGDLRTTLITPLSRTRIVMEKFFAASLLIIILNLVTVAGIYVGLLSLSETAPQALIWELFALSCLFGVTAFSIPFSIALATGNRAVTMAIGLTIAIGSYIVSTFARSVDWLKDWDYLSLMHYYDTLGVRNSSFNPINIWVLFTISAIMLAIGILVFRKRDVA